MKNVIATSVITLLLGACTSETPKKENASKEELEVPANVAEVFAQQFPNVKNVNWEKEGKNYEAIFKHNVTETSMVITANGEILETETEMDSSTLPENVLVYFDNKYKGYKIAEASKIVLNDGTIKYEAEVNDQDFIFDSNGQFLKTLN